MGRGSLLTLHRLPLGYRVLYSGVLAFIVLGYGVGIVQQVLRSGIGPAGMAHWFLGNADVAEPAHLLFPMAPARLLDEVWRLSLADVLPTVVLLALLGRSDLSPAAGGLLSGTLVLAALADLAAPALVAGGGAGLGWAAAAARLGLAASALVGAGVCMRDMWLRPRSGPRFRRP
ncbi:MAG TPA: hypothetical protein VKB18_06080 [Gemmatimonadota bacterium]|nr:hypothetical protein [Gemmatimonadota bacterium]